jgi:hypothetical protein
MLHVLKTADPKLHKAIVANCNKLTFKGICDCTQIVLHGNIPLTASVKCKLNKHKTSLRKLSERSVALSAKRKFIGQRGGFLVPQLTAIPFAAVMLQKIYLVSPEQIQKLTGVTK